MRAGGKAFSKKVVPDTPGTMGAVAIFEAAFDLSQENLVIPGMVTRGTMEPGMKAGTRDIQRFAQPW